MAQTFDLVVCIGLFQPGLAAHVAAVRQALSLAPTCLILVKNANAGPTPRHPFSLPARAAMLMQELQPDELRRTNIARLRGDYNIPRQLQTLQELATAASSPTAQIGVLMLDHEPTRVPPTWTSLDSAPFINEQPTRLRNALFGAPAAADALARYADVVPKNTLVSLQQWILSAQFAYLRNEWESIHKQRAEWADAPYPPVFVTVDAVVSCANHVLLIQRAQAPGQGRLALPGGFIDTHETLQESALRELAEETTLQVSEHDLHASLKAVGVFDAPLRSQRGRVITHAYHFDLPANVLPPITAADDAAQARWTPLTQLSQLENQFHDDHFLILDEFLHMADWTPPSLMPGSDAVGLLDDAISSWNSNS